MPAAVTPDGQTVYIPGAYTSLRVVSTLPGPAPAFNVPVIMGNAFEGRPYHIDEIADSSETQVSAFFFAGTPSAAADEFGPDSDIVKAFRFAQRHGLPLAYLLCLSKLTRAAAIVDASGTEQFTLYSKKAGAPGSWPLVQFAGGIFTTTPVRRYAALTANLGGTATRIYVKNNDWIQAGLAYTIVDNSAGSTAITISSKGVELDTDGRPLYWVEVSSAPGAHTTANYAAIVEYDSANTEANATAFTTAQAFIDWVNNNSTYWLAVKHANFDDTLPDAVASAVSLGEVSAWGTITKGTSPVATGTDVTDWVADMNAREWERFVTTYSAIPRAYLFAIGTHSMHVSMRDYAIAERTRGYPISVHVGTDWGDTVIGAGDSTAPEWRAGVLNHEDVAISAGGLDNEPAAISMSAAVFGRRVGNGLPHNLTNDTILYESREVDWDEINSGQLTTLTRAGVITQRLRVTSSPAYVISQGLSTLQDNEGTIWNEVTRTTWSLMQRDLSDFVQRVFKEDMDTFIVGADQIDRDAVASRVIRRAEGTLLKAGLITSYQITSITLNSGANGYDVEWNVRFPTTVDFITGTLSVLIGE